MNDLLTSIIAFDGGLTLLPPLVAIVLALLTKRVLPSLGIAIVIGAFVATKMDPIAALSLCVEIVVSVATDMDNLTVSVFSLCVAGLVGVAGKSGGTQALIGLVERFAKSRRGAMTSSWLSGGVIFFDDYANCLVVGSAMGPLCDRYQISRAKLAYLVDATAAPVASLAVVSTWVGFEVSQVGKALTAAGSELTPFSVFIDALPYRFYCIFTLIFVGVVALSGRDWGPMLRAEEDALTKEYTESGRTLPPARRAWLAAVPVATLVVVTFGWIVYTGWTSLEDPQSARFFEILGEGDAYGAMLRGSALALVLAALMTMAMKALTPVGTGKAAIAGGKTVLQALGVLYLAWTLGDIIEAAGAADFLATALEGRMAPWLFPVATFLVAAATSFSVGSSFFTMGALIPLVVPLAVALDGGATGPILLATTAAVLDGAVLGDHASPISDTTILSALGSQVSVVDHVRTQLPYALAVGTIAVVAGSIPAGLGLSPWLLIPIGAVLCIITMYVLGRRPTVPA